MFASVRLRRLRWHACVSARKEGRLALKAHRWGMRVAEHVAGGFNTAWPGDCSSLLDVEWIDERTHCCWVPRGVPKNEPTWARVCAAGAVLSEL